MALPNVMNTGRSGMMASKAGIATTGHNIANSTTEGYSRQRVQQTTDVPRHGVGSKGLVGQGTLVDRVERVNDRYLEKHLRNAGREVAYGEEKDTMLRQVESIFNEMGGDGLNRVMTKFFNEFRKLSNDPDNEAVRQSVREGAQAMVNDFKRLRSAVDEVRRHIDSRIENGVKEVNAMADEIRSLNTQIKEYEIGGASPNDLLDKRDLILKKLGSYMSVNMHTDSEGAYSVEIPNVGPLVVGGRSETFSVERSPADGRGKPEAAFDIKSSSSANNVITHSLKGGKLGALLDVRDRSIGTILDRLDDLAYNVATAVNQVHRQGYTRNNMTGVDFFAQPMQRERAAEYLSLSNAVQSNVDFIAAAAMPDSPADNRIAGALAALQGERLMGDGTSTVDDFYNSIVADVGVATNRNTTDLNQKRDQLSQLNKFREQISGVSIDEETTNLLQYQHTFDASAKVIQVADEMLKTVLDLRR